MTKKGDHSFQKSEKKTASLSFCSVNVDVLFPLTNRLLCLGASSLRKQIFTSCCSMLRWLQQKVQSLRSAVLRSCGAVRESTPMTATCGRGAASRLLHELCEVLWMIYSQALTTFLYVKNIFRISSADEEMFAVTHYTKISCMSDPVVCGMITEKKTT